MHKSTGQSPAQNVWSDKLLPCYHAIQEHLFADVKSWSDKTRKSLPRQYINQPPLMFSVAPVM